MWKRTFIAILLILLALALARDLASSEERVRLAWGAFTILALLTGNTAARWHAPLVPFALLGALLSAGYVASAFVADNSTGTTIWGLAIWSALFVHAYLVTLRERRKASNQKPASAGPGRVARAVIGVGLTRWCAIAIAVIFAAFLAGSLPTVHAIATIVIAALFLAAGYSDGRRAGRRLRGIDGPTSP